MPYYICTGNDEESKVGKSPGRLATLQRTHTNGTKALEKTTEETAIKIPLTPVTIEAANLRDQ